MTQIDQHDLDQYLFDLKSEISNLRSINDKFNIQITNLENDNVNLKSQISKLAIENSTLENHIKIKSAISKIMYDSYRDIISKLEDT
jgi:hypothetical protein